jgi:hypothetical protein
VKPEEIKQMLNMVFAVAFFAIHTREVHGRTVRAFLFYDLLSPIITT